MNYMVRRTRSAIFGRCTIFLTTQIRLDSEWVPGYWGRQNFMYGHVLIELLVRSAELPNKIQQNCSFIYFVLVIDGKTLKVF